MSKPAYVWNDTVTPNLTASSATGHYVIDFPASNDVEDMAGNRYQCAYTSYDGQPYTSGSPSVGLTAAMAASIAGTRRLPARGPVEGHVQCLHVGRQRDLAECADQPEHGGVLLYDGQGQRGGPAADTGRVAATTVHVGGVEEVATSGATTTTTTYYYAGGKRIGLSVNGVVSYLASDGLGSADVTLSGSGSVLYSPLRLHALQQRHDAEHVRLHRPISARMPYVDEANDFNSVGVGDWAPIPRWLTSGVTEEGEPIPIVEPIEDPWLQNRAMIEIFVWQMMWKAWPGGG